MTRRDFYVITPAKYNKIRVPSSSPYSAARKIGNEIGREIFRNKQSGSEKINLTMEDEYGDKFEYKLDIKKSKDPLHVREYKKDGVKMSFPLFMNTKVKRVGYWKK